MFIYPLLLFTIFLPHNYLPFSILCCGLAFSNASSISIFTYSPIYLFYHLSFYLPSSTIHFTIYLFYSLFGYLPFPYPPFNTQFFLFSLLLSTIIHTLHPTQFSLFSVLLSTISIPSIQFTFSFFSVLLSAFSYLPFCSPPSHLGLPHPS